MGHWHHSHMCGYLGHAPVPGMAQNEINPYPTRHKSSRAVCHRVAGWTQLRLMRLQCFFDDEDFIAEFQALGEREHRHVEVIEVMCHFSYFDFHRVTPSSALYDEGRA